uniref:ATP synthase complex subunit 8 n=1 Tax=Glyptotermes sp. A TB-2014 TaxID=1576351 RepID=A0A0A7E7R8_9NEOP|nr:ATP synthase F0 subunit 8 [Glyptotermes sp. A TB-2014]
MPQMMPMSWLTLFISFSTTLILFATMNYYMHMPEITTIKKTSIKMNSMTWKW